MCFTMRNTLFHEEKHFVSVKETLCFFKRNTLFHKGKQIVSQRETDCFTKGNRFGNVYAKFATLVVS